MEPSVQKLTSVIKRVRDILRKVGITDMDSMMHCVLFVAARMLTPDILKLLKLAPPLEWKNLMKKINEKDITTADKLFRNILDSLDTKFGTKGFPYRLTGSDDFIAIMKAFDEVDIHEAAKHTDVLGYVYEQHLSKGSGNGGGRELGKFYTDRQITKYLTELLGVEITSAGRPDSMCDATMGTGGFILSYIDMVSKKFPDVKWELQDLAGGDIDDKVAAIARLNVFLHTGKVFPMIRQRDTLKNDISADVSERRTFDRVLMNEPFGVKGLTLADNCCERVKEIVKSGTKSEPLFLALSCQLLAEGGKAAVIVPDGVLTASSKQHSAMRRYLLDNFQLKRIIKMRGKFFMNTGIQPSVLVFERNGKTREVEFWDVEKVDSGELVETCLVKVARERFDNMCSFDIKQYQEITVQKNVPGVTMMRLGDLLKDSIVKKAVSTRNAAGGEYKLFSSSCDVFRHNVAEFPAGEYLIQGSRGTIAKATHYCTTPFSVSNNAFVLTAKDPRCSLKYIYHYLRISQITDRTAVTAIIPMLTKTMFNGIMIPVPPADVQKGIVDKLDAMEADREYHMQMIATAEAREKEAMKEHIQIV